MVFLFTLLIVSFNAQSFKIFLKSNLSFFGLLLLRPLVSYPPKSLPNQCFVLSFLLLLFWVLYLGS